MKNNMTKRLLSLILCLAMVLSLLPMTTYAADTASNRVADPSTMDSWKDLFLQNPLNTNNAGAVWTDKSVFTDASAFAGSGITRDSDNSFLVALSAMGANMSVTGLSNMPTDTMMILDLSSSMYNGFSRNPATVQTMLQAVNDSINRLQNLNPLNRVGVVIYYGYINRLQSDASHSMVLLPLDRYSGNTNYLKANVSGGKLISVAVNSGVINSAGKTMPQTTRVVTDVAGTYAQLGILDAMDQLLAADTIVPATAEYQANVTRVPVFIFMSDGEPTAATHQYTKKADAGMGNNTVHIRYPNETDFVTQLTAAYAKKMVDDHYVATKPVFYSLSLGTSVSLSVMDPANNTTATIDGYWTKLLNNGSVDITVYNSPDSWRDPSIRKTYTVSKTTANGETFPSGMSQRNYVDKMFTATTAGDLTAAFSDIVDQINLVSEYTPTLITDNADLSGYISFVDKIGEYMNVTDIKGILINNQLYSGAELSKNFIAGGGNLGTYDDPKPLGDEMVWAVQARLGIDNVDTARTLIGLAYEHGQLSYDVKTGAYSNYIGWYANAAGKFLGFWHEGITTIPEPTGNFATDPAFIIKSYGYLGAVDEHQGVAASDMMYATVQVRENISTGEQSVAFAVPAALIPLITYEVELGQNGELTSLKATGATAPIRLVYEVALDEAINPYTLSDTVSAEYLAANTDENGYVNFYSNQYEADNTTGYGKVNTYSYFNPSRQNDRYYYLENAPVYTDTAGTLYTGTQQPSGTFYRRYTVYEKDGDKLNIHTVYRKLSDAALATAKQRSDGSWYIGKGNVHVNLDGYTMNKTANPTDTLTGAYIPFVDAHNHSVGELGYNFIVGATLGNNGRLSITPATGIALSKAMAQGVDAPNEAFRFTITNTAGGDDSAVYTAVLRDADGTETATTVKFENGKATVSLYAGQTLYIGGMTAGTAYTVEEVETLLYVPQTPSVDVTVTDKTMIDVNFVNTDRGTGDLTVSKAVNHPLGSDYQLPENLKFTIQVTLTGMGVTNATFNATHTDGTVETVTTDANGTFTTVLGHKEQLTVSGIPAGVTATVTEPKPGTGFAASYLENGQAGDGIVTIPKNGTASVTVENRYTPGKVEPVSILLTGTKVFTTGAADWNGAEFEFQLQKWTANGWTTIATDTANEANLTFDFNAALQAEEFTAPGTYAYQVLETNGGKTINGITYDATLHTFGVIVTDGDMDGALEISQVVSHHSGKEFGTDAQGNWKIEITFNNTYNATGTDLYLDVQKALQNLSNSPLVSLAGFRFGLYEDGELVASSELTDSVGEARLMLHYELADEGKHEYILKEIVPDTKIPGMNYSAQEYAVTVQVTDNGDGTMSAAIVSIDGKTDYDIPVFTNVYQPKPVELPVDFVSKKLTGRDLVPEEFHFEIYGTNNDQKLQGKNDGDGNVIFDGNLFFDQVGVWHFNLVETTTDGKGITTDKTVYNVTVTVTDEGGQLVADHHVLNVVGDSVTFRNTYEAKPTSYSIRGTKQLTGRTLLNNEFTFVLRQATDNKGTIDEYGKQWTVRNFASGNFSFAPVTFYKADTYYFAVTEQAESGASFGITFDNTLYVVTVKVIDNLEGNLEVDDVTITIPGKGEKDEILFTNVYKPNPTSVEIAGNKTLIGKVLGGGDYSFELYASDENWNLGDWMETVENGDDGSFSFQKIDYETAGTRYYLVKEVDGGKTIDGVTYDGTIYRVTVDITDNLRGDLESEVTITNSDGVVFDTATFVNTYRITGEAQVILPGTKTLNGKDLGDGDFKFLLYKTDENFLVEGDPFLTAENVGKELQFQLDYTTEDVGATHYYVAKEKFAGQTINGVTYSNALYYVTVQVRDNEVGGIETVTTITDGENTVESLDFVNEYAPAPTEVIFSGIKTLEGRDLTAGEFTFELYETDETGTPISDAVTTTNGTGDTIGSFAFQPIAITDTTTRYFLIREVNGGETIDRVTYDDGIYRITVKVTDNLEGELEVALDITTGSGEEAEAVTFLNTYDPPEVPEIPKTGDISLSLWAAMLAVSAGGVITLLTGKKSDEDEEE